jgi:hypothetical protein
MNTILAPIDFSAGTRKAIAGPAPRARKLSARIVLLRGVAQNHRADALNLAAVEAVEA